VVAVRSGLEVALVVLAWKNRVAKDTVFVRRGGEVLCRL